MRVNHDFVAELKDIVQPKAVEIHEIPESPFNAKTVVITGTLSKARGEFKSQLEALGAKVSSSVSKKTDFLLYGEDAGSKYEKAVSLGVELLDEESFNAIISA